MPARKRPRDKGGRGEREVVDLFRQAGFKGTIRSPGSGALRSYGAGSPSPFPGDLIVKRNEYARAENVLVEVKFDERVETGGTRTWPGSTFIKATLRSLEKEATRVKVIGRPSVLPVLFARASHSPWRVWVSDLQFVVSFGGPPVALHLLAPGSWAEITPEMFFEVVMPCVAPTAEDAIGS